ncbi:MAG TPA: putative Se/S carrier-like protein, partial [Clostridia bacterium]
SQVLLLEKRLKSENVVCELTYVPREVMLDVCNMGIRFKNSEMEKAMAVINRSGLPGISIFIETPGPDGSTYEKLQ